MTNTHIAVTYFSGDPDCEHPDEALRGRSPHLTLVASGPEEFCWEALTQWVTRNPLRLWERGEVLARHRSAVRQDPTKGRKT